MIGRVYKDRLKGARGSNSYSDADGSRYPAEPIPEHIEQLKRTV